VHAEVSGIAHGVYGSEPECLAAIRELVGWLPANNLDPAPNQAVVDPEDRREESLLRVIPEAPSSPYDMHEVVRAVMDQGRFFEIHAAFAGNMIVGFARLGGRSVGVVANQPAVLAGVLDINASVKAARVHPILRRIQHPARHLRRRARLSARDVAGARRHHPARGQAALRLL
jgi:propionyl-CoA carboxylase beta chain